MIHDNTLGHKIAIPVRFITDSHTQSIDANELIENEIPTGISEGFSFAEFLRSLFAGFRVG